MRYNLVLAGFLLYFVSNFLEISMNFCSFSLFPIELSAVEKANHSKAISEL